MLCQCHAWTRRDVGLGSRNSSSVSLSIVVVACTSKQLPGKCMYSMNDYPGFASTTHWLLISGTRCEQASGSEAA
jgi:hypothetical protein